MTTEREIVSHIECLLSDLRNGTGEYDGEGAEGISFLLSFKNGKKDESETSRNVDDFMKVLRYAALEVANGNVVDMLLYPVPYGSDDPLEYEVDRLRALRDGRRVKMTYDELSEDQKTQVKQQLMISLANNGVFIANMRRWHPDDYQPDEVERGPSWGELSDAYDLVPDEAVAQDGVNYVLEDFEGGDGYGRC